MYPLYLVGLLLASLALVAAFMVHAPTNWSPAEFGVAFGFALLFAPTPPMHTDAIFPLNNPAWSLFFELVANVLFAVLWKQLTTKVCIIVVGISGLVLIGADAWYGNLDLGSNWPTFWVGFPRVGYSFFLGVLLSRLLRRRASMLRVSPWLVLLAVAVTLSAYPGAWRWAYDLGCVLIILPLLVWAAALVEPAGASRVIFTGLGAASYPMYTIHVPLLTIAAKKFGPDMSVLGPAFGGIFVVAMVVGGILLDRVDRVVRAYLTRISANRSEAPKLADPAVIRQ